MSSMDLGRSSLSSEGRGDFGHCPPSGDAGMTKDDPQVLDIPGISTRRHVPFLKAKPGPPISLDVASLGPVSGTPGPKHQMPDPHPKVVIELQDECDFSVSIVKPTATEQAARPRMSPTSKEQALGTVAAARPLSSSKITNSILYPDRDSLSDEIFEDSSRPVVKRPKTEALAMAEFKVFSIQVGERVVTRDGYRDIMLTVDDSGFFQLLFSFQDSSASSTRMLFDRATAPKSVVCYSFAGPAQADFLFSSLPKTLLDFGFDGSVPVLRVTIPIGKAAQFKCALNRAFRPVFTELLRMPKYEDVASDYRADQRAKEYLSTPSSSFEVSDSPLGVHDPLRRSTRIACKQSVFDSGSPLPPSSSGYRILSTNSPSSSDAIAGAIPPAIPSKVEVLFIYPEHGVGPVTLTNVDAARLEPGVFLNDSLIDFDLRYQYENLSDELRGRVLILSSFFFRRILDEGAPGVRSWTEELKLFDKDYIFVPICEHLHWYLAVICHPRFMLGQDSDTPTGWATPDALELDCAEDERLHDDRLCTILIFDSIGGRRGGTLARLKTFLVDEASEKLALPAARGRSVGINVKCPRQDNYTDCGLFCCQYVEAFLKEPDAVVGRSKALDLAEWFPVQSARERRQRLQELVTLLHSASTYIAPEDPGHSSDIEEITILPKVNQL